MKDLALAYLNSKHTQPWNWTNDPSAYNLFTFLFDDGFSIGDYRPYVSTLRKKQIKDLTLFEVKVYLTMLAQHDRVSDCYSSAIEKGTLDALLNRYLVLSI